MLGFESVTVKPAKRLFFIPQKYAFLEFYQNVSFFFVIKSVMNEVLTLDPVF